MIVFCLNFDRLNQHDSLDDVRYRTRMSIADDLSTMARVGGNTIYYTGPGIGQGLNVAIDAYNCVKNDNEEEDVEPEMRMDEEVFIQTQGLEQVAHAQQKNNQAEATKQ